MKVDGCRVLGSLVPLFLELDAFLSIGLFMKEKWRQKKGGGKAASGVEHEPNDKKESKAGLVGGKGGSVFRWDDHHGVTVLWPPHQHLGVVGVGFDHGVSGDGFVLPENLWLLLGQRLFEDSAVPQGFLRVHLDVKPHPPADGLQDDRLRGGLVDGHQPGGKALVAADAAELRHVAVTDRHAPRHAGVEIVVHADGELAVLLRGSHNHAGLRRVAVPGIVDPV